jgi:hypothetical protein
MQSGEKKSYTNTIILVTAAIGVFVAGYFYFTRDRSSDILLSSDIVNSSASIQGDLLVVLRQLAAVELDAAIFSDFIFKQSLTDFGRVLVPERPGKNNPFAPLSLPASGDKRPAGSTQ